jgi:hypothetical protein
LRKKRQESEERSRGRRNEKYVFGPDEMGEEEGVGLV